MKEDNNSKVIKRLTVSIKLSKEEHIRNTNKWKKFSMMPQKEEEIRKKYVLCM